MLLVIGGGPYGISVAARAAELGLETLVVGRPMAFWREHMPHGMFLRSGPDWHLDAAGVHTFEAFLADQKVSRSDIDPIPIEVFLEYAGWFQAQKEIVVRERLVTALTTHRGRFEATLDDGDHVTADAVVAAPGAGYFQHIPPWADSVPEGIAAHTCDLPSFDAFGGTRVLIVGGRQSAYEWAALIGEHGAERVDIVHRHNVPRFERVSWSFVDPYLENTLTRPGWWRLLRASEREAINEQFWRAGRLTLEWWLTPRLVGDRFHRWPGTHVVQVASDQTGGVVMTLSNGESLGVDRIVFATGYKADLSRVPYLDGLIDRIDVDDGHPVLDEAFQTSLSGLYIPGLAASRDFGPFFGFTKGCPAAAALIVDDLRRRS